MNRDLVARLRAASQDDRLATGGLYREAADMLLVLQAKAHDLEGLLRVCRGLIAEEYGETERPLLDRLDAALTED